MYNDGYFSELLDTVEQDVLQYFTPNIRNVVGLLMWVRKYSLKLDLQTYRAGFLTFFDVL